MLTFALHATTMIGAMQVRPIAILVISGSDQVWPLPVSMLTDRVLAGILAFMLQGSTTLRFEILVEVFMPAVVSTTNKR